MAETPLRAVEDREAPAARGEEAAARPRHQSLPWRVARRLAAYSRWVLVATKVAIPFLLAGAYILYVVILIQRGIPSLGVEPLRGEVLFLVLAYFIPPAGKESVIPAGLVLGVPWPLMAALIAVIDVIVGLFLVWNYPALYRIPVLGDWVRRAEAKARKRVERRGLFFHFVFVGIVLLVMLPFQGSGAVSATIVGRLMGMGAVRTWIAIILGAPLGTILVAYLVVTGIAFLS